MKKTIRVLMGVVLAAAMCPVGTALADDAAIANVKTLLDVIYPVDPITLDASDTTTINNIKAAQTAFNQLSAEDQATLNTTPYDGTGVTKPSSAKPWGRVLESAVWSLDLFDAVDNSTTLPDGTYSNGIASLSDQGLYNSSTVRTWAFRDITVKDGKAYGTLYPSTEKATDSVYVKMRTGGKLYESVDNGEIVIEEYDVSGSKQERSVFPNVPVALGKTMTFAVEGRSFGKIPYRITTTLDDAVIAPQAAAYAFINQVNALPSTIKLTDLSAVEKAVDAYAALSAEAKALVPANIISKMNGAVETLGKLKQELEAKAAAAKAEAKAKKVTKVTVNVKKVTKSAINKAIKKAGGKAKYVKTIVLGKKVKKIAKGAFKSFKKATTVQVKSTKLKKSAVKGCFKSSKVKTVKVPKAKKKAYKKIFTKKNCGKKVKIK